MSNPSNLYAQKIFSEHPIAMWALDDKADYISLISNSKRSIHAESPNEDVWVISGGTKEAYTSSINAPLPDTPTSLIVPSELSGETGQITITSSEIVDRSSLRLDLETFSVGAHILSTSHSVISYEIGYTYDGLPSPVFKKFETQIANKWSFVSETFTINPSISSVKIVLRITYSNNGGNVEDYKFYVNGITLGQWSEDFSTTSSGIFPAPLPENLPVDGHGVEAALYGLRGAPGYYIASENFLCAKNAGSPMVYGSSNVTRIFQNPSAPSLVIPGYGFLNEVGRYRDYTVEMWLRIDSKALLPTRIFGPLSSDDGIYVDGPFIKLKVGNEIGAHPVGEWFRPMLVHIKISENAASLLINGEEVISLSYSTKDLSLPQQDGVFRSRQVSQDWLGFYAHGNVPMIEVDCVAIYTYLVPSIVAKRRFAYGQAVEFPENANSAYRGTSVLIDYSFADYTNNYSYPDIGKWTQASVQNLEVVDESLSVPEYSLPAVSFSDDTTTESWYEDLYGVQEDTILYPLSGPESVLSGQYISFLEKDAYLVFESLDVLKNRLAAFYAIVKPTSISNSEQILIRIENKNSGDSLSVSTQGNILSYKLKSGIAETTLYSESTVLPYKPLAVGLDLEKFSRNFSRVLGGFFNNPSKLRLYIMGDTSFEKTFTGRLYSFGLCSSLDLSKINRLFDSSGILSYFNYEDIFDQYDTATSLDAGDEYFDNNPAYDEVRDGGAPVLGERLSMSYIQNFVSSYTLIPKVEFGSIYMDIAISGYWEDYLPLSYFAQYVSDPFGKKYYDLDFIQFNIDFPTLENFDGAAYDTSSSLVKTYVTFQYLNAGPSASDSYFNKLPALKNGVLSPGPEWLNSKYEVVDGTVVYPPKNIKIENLSIVTHIEWNVPGIISNPLTIKKLQYASQAFNEASSNPIGTRFGIPVFPYLKYGSYFDYKSRNPYRIYKGGSPYLYLTKNSGIEKVGNYDPLVNRGFIIPINENLSENYKMAAMQAFIRYGKDRFSTTPEQIFEIESKDRYIKFFIVANDVSGKRARVYAVNAKTGRFENGIAFYLNGKPVREPVIGLGEWSALGVSFSRVLRFDRFAGGLRVTGQILINNISQYQPTEIEEVLSQSLAPTQPGGYIWDNWKTDFTWNGMLVFSTKTGLTITPSEIYEAYTGTGKVIAGDDVPLRIDDYQYLTYASTNWKVIALKPT